MAGGCTAQRTRAAAGRSTRDTERSPVCHGVAGPIPATRCAAACVMWNCSTDAGRLAKHGAKPPSYIVELLCVQEFQDAQEWKGRGGAGRSRASAASNGDGPGLSLEGAEGMEGADAEALAQRILSHQLQADQHSLLCPVTHTHVLWDEGVAAKMYKAAAKD